MTSAMTDASLRVADLRQMLERHRGNVRDEMRVRVREGRTSRPNEIGDHVDRSDADVQGDIECALLQMRAETVVRIDEALARLDAGQYGRCADCDDDVSESRLRALPFAVRCAACAAAVERGYDQSERATLRRNRLPLFSDLLSA